MDVLLVIVGVALVLSFLPGFFLMLHAIRKYRGTLAVSCPEKGGIATIRFARLRTAFADLTGGVGRLKSCSRLAPGETCGEGCIAGVARQ